MPSSRPVLPVAMGSKSSFCPAREPDGSLLVFVHGFRGGALSTWMSFPSALDSTPELAGADALFYGYRSRPLRLQNMAIGFRRDMNALWSDRESLGRPVAALLSDAPRWKRVIFVAHSLGAVVVRRAVLDAFLEATPPKKSHWTRKATLCFFAPAHSGADALRLVAETFSTVGLPVASLLKLRFPCLQDLDERGPTLESLRADHAGLPELLRAHATARAVILAENDLVVNPNRFPGDPVPRQIDGRGHVDVCKPSNDFLEPVDEVQAVSKRSSKKRN